MIGSQSTVAAETLRPIGVWLHQNGRIQVEISPCEDRLCGRIAWLRFPNNAAGRPLRDLKNPNQSLRRRTVMGMTVIRGLHFSGERTWDDGRIYNPDDGKTYRSNVTYQDDNTLLVRAYILLPMFGQTQIWTRVNSELDPHHKGTQIETENGHSAPYIAARNIAPGEGGSWNRN